MSLTTDPNHPDLRRGADELPVPQNKVYLVLSEAEIAKGYVKPYRTSYRHNGCGVVTSMGHELSATYARDPWFYGATYCCGCRMHRRLHEFTWTDGEPMDPSMWPEAEHERIADLRERQERQPLNGQTLDQIIADVETGAWIEFVDLGGYDGHEHHLIKGRYVLTDDTVDKLLRRGVIEPYASGTGYRKAREKPEQNAAATLQSAPSDAAGSGNTGGS